MYKTNKPSASATQCDQHMFHDMNGFVRSETNDNSAF